MGSKYRPPPTYKYRPPPTYHFHGGHISDFSECGWYVGVGLWKVVNLEPIHAIGPYYLPPTGVKLAFCQLYLAARARLVELRTSFTQHDIESQGLGCATIDVPLEIHLK